MSNSDNRGFKFGIEAEYMLVDSSSFRPLWYRDLAFEKLNSILESISISDLPSLEGLELEPPHRKLMPYVVEGYHVPDPELNPIDILPKGIEIRTPQCSSIDECLNCLRVLHERLQSALAASAMTMVAVSHHPLEDHFEGPQNKRRYDYWRWAMEVMTTYGPDINISLPQTMRQRLNLVDLHAKANFYGPALTALTLASPFRAGDLWKIRGRTGKSLRTYRRSVFGQLIELHPHEDYRLEFKSFEMTGSLSDFASYLLLWLTLLIDESLPGRASYQSRIYDLGRLAVEGLEYELMGERAAEVLRHAYKILPARGFDPAPLDSFTRRLKTRWLPADDLIELLETEGSIESVLRHHTPLSTVPSLQGILD